MKNTGNEGRSNMRGVCEALEWRMGMTELASYYIHPCLFFVSAGEGVAWNY